jgi:hypothetical protein
MATGLSSLVPDLIPYAEQLVSIAASAGLSPRVSSARRSHAQQALLYRRFLAGQSRFPAAPPGTSAHEFGLAFDLWINDEEQLADLGQVWEDMGGVWGGRFHDPIHFEAADVKAYIQATVPQAEQDNASQRTLDAVVPAYISSGQNLLAQIPIIGAPAELTAHFLGIDPTQMYTRFRSWF